MTGAAGSASRSNALAPVAVFAPSGYDADPSRLERAAAYFRSRGHRVVLGGASHRHQRFAGSDTVRLAAIETLAAVPDPTIAIALRGSYGLTRLLPHLDFASIAASIRRHGKRFVGHSDFTAFNLGLLATSGAVSFAGPMASFDFGGDAVDAFTERHFWRVMEGGDDSVSFVTTHPDFTVQGTLWGGNLTMLASLVGTPWMPSVEGGILFIEDVNEHPYRIERMLLQLHQAGILERQAAVLCGDFSNYRLSDYDNGYTLDAAFAYLRSVTRVPFVTGLPFGHCRSKLTLPVGARAEIAVANGECQLEMCWQLSADVLCRGKRSLNGSVRPG